MVVLEGCDGLLQGPAKGKGKAPKAKKPKEDVVSVAEEGGGGESVLSDESRAWAAGSEGELRVVTHGEAQDWGIPTYDEEDGFGHLEALVCGGGLGEGTTLVLTCEAPPNRRVKRVKNLLEACAEVVECGVVAAWDADGIAQKVADVAEESYGLRLDSEASLLVASLLGDKQGGLRARLARLAVDRADGGEVSGNDVVAVFPEAAAFRGAVGGGACEPCEVHDSAAKGLFGRWAGSVVAGGAAAGRRGAAAATAVGGAEPGSHLALGQGQSARGRRQDE